ncbi:UNVERIFIED_CONTAM: hypothetical protein GTU68_062302 [Idotea baltica]|nr:hypothetical protein [Idotea baltica]
MLAITILELMKNDLIALKQQLAQKVAQAPSFFDNVPLILALDKLPDNNTVDLLEIITICSHYGLKTLAIRSENSCDILAAKTLNIPILPLANTHERDIQLVNANKEQSRQEPEIVNNHKPTLVITNPVRSGQQIYAQNSDLIMLAPVSSGAEVLADGNIHLYAPMRGRALAGIKGDESTCIFCHHLSAELLSIAGRYKIAEDLRRDPSWHKDALIQLQNNELAIRSL